MGYEEDPRMQGAWAGIGPPPERPGADFDPDDPEQKAMADRWREWARQEDTAINKGFEQGMSLEDMGYRNAPDQGKSVFSRYGPGGFFSEYGSNVDPNFQYDWVHGVKRNIATSDPVGRETWVPINKGEREGYREAQREKAQGFKSYQEHQGHYRLMRDLAAGHIAYDPKTGMYYNAGQDPSTSTDIRDKFGRRVGGGSNTPTRPYNAGVATAPTQMNVPAQNRGPSNQPSKGIPTTTAGNPGGWRDAAGRGIGNTGRPGSPRSAFSRSNPWASVNSMSSEPSQVQLTNLGAPTASIPGLGNKENERALYY